MPATLPTRPTGLTHWPDRWPDASAGRLVREGWIQQVRGNLRQAFEKVKDAFRR
jgi:hypothetical protein